MNVKTIVSLVIDCDLIQKINYEKTAILFVFTR